MGGSRASTLKHLYKAVADFAYTASYHIKYGLFYSRNQRYYHTDD